MKKNMIFFAVWLLTFTVFAKDNFTKYFLDKTLRIDYYITGDSKKECIAIDCFYKYDKWAGRTTNLIAPFSTGVFRIKVYSEKTGQLIYSYGFNTYFSEYQTTDKALNGIYETYHETALIPYPKNKVKFVIEKRDRKHNIKTVFETVLDLSNTIVATPKKNKELSTVKVLFSGNPHKKADIVIIGEGYTKLEKQKFLKDLSHFANVFLSHKPYCDMKNCFNITGIFVPSKDSGPSEPTHGKFNNTAVSTTFNSLGSYRYLLTKDNKALRDIAGTVPYDAIFVMVNSARYGGAGIYNFFCTFTTDNIWSNYVFLHEFGHSFSGLADEYYSSSTSYNDFYPKGVEPNEANITRLLDGKDNLKWKSLLSKGIEVPTPWRKKIYDKKDEEYQRERRKLNKEIAILAKKGINYPKQEELKKKAQDLSKKHKKWCDNFFKTSPYFNKVGVFEGAGYSSTGIYRPSLDCIMFSRGVKDFCLVCENHIKKVIKSYCE
jgi:hypothetical protein